MMELEVKPNLQIDGMLCEKVVGWGKARGILEKSDPLSQILKTGAELGELCDAVNKGQRDLQIDGVGDVVVTLILVTELAGCIDQHHPLMGVGLDSTRDAKSAMAKVMQQVGQTANLLSMGVKPTEVYNSVVLALGWLQVVADKLDIGDLNYCTTLAYQEIAGRTGKMVDGVFVKDN